MAELDIEALRRLDAYRAELLHAWRLRRLAEAIAAVREARHVLEDDIATMWEFQAKIERLDHE